MDLHGSEMDLMDFLRFGMYLAWIWHRFGMDLHGFCMDLYGFVWIWHGFAWIRHRFVGFGMDLAAIRNIKEAAAGTGRTPGRIN